MHIGAKQVVHKERERQTTIYTTDNYIHRQTEQRMDKSAAIIYLKKTFQLKTVDKYFVIKFSVQRCSVELNAKKGYIP